MANETKTPMTEKTDLKTQLTEVAERIRTMREIMGLSEEEMAQRTNVSVEDYRRYEKGIRELPLSYAIILAQHYNVSIDYIVELTDEKSPK